MLVDTDVLVWYMRGHEGARRLLDQSAGFSISAMTYMEVVQGMRNKAELRALKTAMGTWATRLLTIDDRVSTQAMILVERHFHSHGIRAGDAIIGATALVHGLELHTANVKHYRMLRGVTMRPFRPDE